MTSLFVSLLLDALPHAADGGPLLPSSHRTVPLVRPKIDVFGFAAAGNAGKASEPTASACREEGGLDVGLDEAGDGRADELTQGVALTRPAPTLFAEAGIAGKATAEAAWPQLPCLLTADRED